MMGYIYVIQQEPPEGQAYGPMKVGYTSTFAGVSQRLATLQTGNPAPLSISHVFGGSLELEQAIHAFLAEDRMKGEWFYPSLRVVQLLLLSPTAALDDHTLAAWLTESLDPEDHALYETHLPPRPTYSEGT